MTIEYKYCPLCGNELTGREIDGVERKACAIDGCGFVHWDNPVPVVAAIVEHEGEIILVRNKGWPERVFGLITGFLERDETPGEGVLREIQEELGLHGKIAEFVGYYPFFQANQLILAFHVKARGDLELGEELADYRRVEIERLRPWPFGTGHAVKDWLDSRRSGS
jgi:NADH pyrophosphatase NudC (nudix superfamily)